MQMNLGPTVLLIWTLYSLLIEGTAIPDLILPSLNFTNVSVSSQYPPRTEDIQPPDGFTIIARSPGVSLNETACMVNTVRVAAELALDDWNKPFEKGQIFRSVTYPDVFIAIVVTSQTLAFKRSDAFWGLFMSLSYMINEQFQEYVFDVFSKGELIGHIFFRHQPPASLASSSEETSDSATLSSQDAALLGNTTNNTLTITDLTASLFDKRLVLAVQIPVYRRKLTLPEISMSLMGALSQAGPQPPKNLVDVGDLGILFQVKDVMASVSFEPLKKKRVFAPYFEFQFMIKALGQLLPALLTMNVEFGEFIVWIQISDVLVAEAFVLKYPTPFLFPGGNVSIS